MNTRGNLTTLCCVLLSTTGLWGCASGLGGDMILPDPPEGVSFIKGVPSVEVTGESGTATSYQVGGITVIHKRVSSNRVVTGTLFFTGGVAGLTPETAGIEQLALALATRSGTRSTPKHAFNAAMDSMGSRVWSFAGKDAAGVGFKTIDDHFDATWELFTETVLEPAMLEKDVELQRMMQLAAIKRSLDDPDAHVAYEATQNLFQDHPYALLSQGTKESVEAFTREQVLAHQRSLLVSERMFLVLVGNVSPEDVLEKVQRSFGRVAPGGTPVPTVGPFSSGSGVRFADRELPTNYVIGYFAAPRPGEPDFEATLIAMVHLRDRLFEEVRTKRNLSYAVSAGLSARRQNYGYVYTTATDPQTTMGVIYDQIETLKTRTLTDDELSQVVNVFLTRHFMELETNDGQVSLFQEAHILNGDWRAADTFLERVRAVTPEQIQEVAKRYLKDFRFGVVGPRDPLKPEFFLPR